MIRFTWRLAPCLLGCTPIPAMVPDMDRHAAKRVSREGGNGPLSPASARAVLQRRQQRGGGTGTFERRRAAEEASAGNLLPVGNKVTLRRDGPGEFKAMFAAVKETRDRGNVESCIIEDDEVGNRSADALLAKRAEGVDVNLIHDSVGAINRPAALFDRLRAGGVRVIEVDPIIPRTGRRGWEVNWRDHLTILIVHGRTVFVGGINISGAHSRGSFATRQRPANGSTLPWRDTHGRLQGPVRPSIRRIPST